jgi:hypothetical protein
MGLPSQYNVPRRSTHRRRDGGRKNDLFVDPEVANPGNVIYGNVGYGNIGWPDAHRNEAPFPEWLARFFVKSFCPRGGWVLDPFSGSGTTVAVAVAHGRNAIGLDIRQSQIDLGEIRLKGLTVAEHQAGQEVMF